MRLCVRLCVRVRAVRVRACVRVLGYVRVRVRAPAMKIAQAQIADSTYIGASSKEPLAGGG